MALRTPTLAPDFELLQQKLDGSSLQWHSMECQLVTPLYGGGVKSGTVDEKMPIRVASIRGQLRFWWRLLAKHQWKLGSDAEIRKAEFALWGGMRDGGHGHSSEVFLRVNGVEKLKLTEYKNYLRKNSNPKEPPLLAYAFFPSAMVEKKTRGGTIHEVIEQDLKWILHFRFTKTLVDDSVRQQQILETLRWWGQFGGLGFRSRRGMGSVHIKSCQDFPQIVQPLNQKEVEEAGCQWVKGIKVHESSVAAWEDAVEKLRTFRQGVNVGRNRSQSEKPAGQSRWPEADAIRRIQNRWKSTHKPDLLGSNVFPRSLFGLPMTFKFHYEDTEEPFESILKPTSKERLPSPVLIRPVRHGTKQWVASALLLPYEHLKQLSVQFELNGKNQPNDFEIWDDKVVSKIRPIADNGGGDPLQAFLNYFKK